MARSRFIKASFFENELLGDLDPLDRLFFIGLWTVADYKGCLEYRPKRLKAQLLPYDDGFNPSDSVKNLSRDGFIRSYDVQGKTYLKIVNFDKHQSPHKNERASGSAIPDEPEDDEGASVTVDSINNIEKTDFIGTKTEEIGTARAYYLLLITYYLYKEHMSGKPDECVQKRVSKDDVSNEDINEVFDHWKTTLNHPKAIFSKDKRVSIAARLKDGFTVEELKKAIDGNKASPYHQGENETKTVYDSIGLIFRNTTKTEQFIQRIDNPRSDNNGSTQTGHTTNGNGHNNGNKPTNEDTDAFLKRIGARNNILVSEMSGHGDDPDGIEE